MAPPVAILFLDLEGGWGGSSRSLFHLVSSLDRECWNPVVLLRKDGPVVSAYEKLGITYRIEPDLPSFRPAERKNLLSFLLYVQKTLRARRVLKRVVSFARSNDCSVVHVNHESLALTGIRLIDLLQLPGIFHIRTELKPGVFARYVIRKVLRHAKEIVFISEPVCEHFHQLARMPVDEKRETVVYNICVPADKNVSAPTVINPRCALRVISLSNFSPNRGIDRILDVASVLKRRGVDDIEFYLFGQPAHRKFLGGGVKPYHSSLVDRVNDGGLEKIVHFPGHLSKPDGALNAADVLIKLTRESNPWGRDIMEGMAAGLAIVTLGQYKKFVEPGVNGYLEPEYDPESIADFLLTLRDNPKQLRQISELNTAKARKLFGAEEISETYSQVLARAHGLTEPESPSR